MGARLTDIHRLLVEGDPVVVEPSLPAQAVTDMRHRIVMAQHDRPHLRWTWGMALVSALGATVVAGVALTWPREPLSVQPGMAMTGAPGIHHRQLQFATPAGTRVIWQFNSDFDMEVAR